LLSLRGASIAAHAGVITDSDGNAQKVNRAAPNAPSVIYDRAVVLGGDSAVALSKSGVAIHFVMRPSARQADRLYCQRKPSDEGGDVSQGKCPGRRDRRRRRCRD
jgi:hypothetical protein